MKTNLLQCVWEWFSSGSFDSVCKAGLLGVVYCLNGTGQQSTVFVLQDTLRHLGDAIPVAASTALAAAQAVQQLLEHPVALHLLQHPPASQANPQTSTQPTLVLTPSAYPQRFTPVLTPSAYPSPQPLVLNPYCLPQITTPRTSP